MRDTRTAKYVVTLDVVVNEQNTYGDLLSTGVIHFTTECKATDLAELGQMLSRVQSAIQKP